MEYCKVSDHKLIKVWYIPEDMPVDKIIPEDVTEIGEYAFGALREMTKIIIPSHVKIIGPYAFKDCSGLESVELCEGVERVDYGAFANCTSLESFKYGQGVAFTFFVFHNCQKLTYLDDSRDVARCFYFPTVDTFSIAQPVYTANQHANGYRVYQGRIAEDPFPVGGFKSNRTLYYFVETKDIYGNKYVYRNKDLDLAITGAKYAASHQSFSKFFHKHLDMKSHFTYVDFAYLTGVCNFGELAWNFFTRKVDQSEVTVEGVIFVLDNNCKILADRLRDAIQHQDEEYNYLDFKYYLNDEQTQKLINIMRATK